MPEHLPEKVLLKFKPLPADDVRYKELALCDVKRENKGLTVYVTYSDTSDRWIETTAPSAYKTAIRHLTGKLYLAGLIE